MHKSLIGGQLANFRIEHLLGQGGMAEVYFGRDTNLERPVAIKVIHSDFRQNPAYAERFISEARAIAAWRHENIVQVYYADQQDDIYYFVMEYIDGMDLASLLNHYADAGELMPHDDVITIARAVASALDYAHGRGVVHRDVKPANTMISTDDRVVLMDFGLALDVQQGSIGEVFGTPHYVSPEQARRSADAVPQSDVYSLGIMLYEMLTGIVPFDDPSPTAVAMQHLSMPPPSPRSLNAELTQEIEDVLLKALAKEPEQRYQSASALVDALEAAMKQPSDTPQVGELPPLPPGVSPPDRHISKRTVSEHIALNVSQTATQRKPEVPRIAPTRQADKPPDEQRSGDVPASPQPAQGNRKLFPGIIIGVVAGLLLLSIGALVILSGNNDDGGNEVANIPTTMPTRTTVAESNVVVEETATKTQTPNPPTNTATATDEPTTEPTATDVPSTLTSTPEPPTATNTPRPTFTPLPPTENIMAEPTVLYPQGQRLQFFWNDNSFYWHNSTGGSLRVSSIRFEALDEAGNVTGYALDGVRWTIGYHSVEPNRCVSVELLQTTDWLRPAQCRGYNSTLTLQRSSDEVFWLSRSGITQFRVFWNEEEVGRCAIAESSCTVNIP